MAAENRSGLWDCHADLQAEWEMFAHECSVKKEGGPNLFMDFWSKKDIPSPTLDKPFCGNGMQQSQTVDIYMEKSCNSQPDNLLEKDDNTEVEDEDVELDSDEQRTIDSLALDLTHTLETNFDEIPDNAQRKILNLSRAAVSHLIIDLRSRLSEQGTYNLCLSLCDGGERGAWIDVSLVFKHLVLPLLTGDSAEPIGTILSAGFVKLAGDFSSACVKHLLYPLITAEKMPRLSLVASVVAVLSMPDFIILLRKYVQICSAPMEEWQLAVLTTLVCEVSPEFLSAGLDAVLTCLLPTLKMSVGPFAQSELFAKLLLAIIPAVGSGVKQDAHNELSIIAKQNKSFSKKKILDALETLAYKNDT